MPEVMERPAIPEAVRKFRQEYRARRIPRFYSGILHCLFTSSVLLGTAAWHLWSLRAPTALELALIPVAFLVGNWFEYAIHRWPLHHVWPGLRRGYEIHSLEHHRFYTYDAMAFERSRDFMMVLFPPWAPVLCAAFCTALGLFAIAPLWSANAGHAFAAMGSAYLFLYEIFHAAHHFADDSWAGKIPFLRGPRRYHRVHHDPRRMSACNFNITFPIFDLVYGTLRSEDRLS
jgi:hypothetical protein